MKKKCINLFVTAMTLVLVMTAVTPVTAEAASPRPTVSGSSKITKGKRAQFSVKYRKKRVSAKSCKWYSTKKRVATVSKSGKVTAKKAGTTYIYVKYKGKKSAKKKVTVKNPVVRPTVSGSSTITKGKSAQFSVKYKKKRVSAKSCKWYSTKKSVATVGKTGRVYAKKAGTAYIYVKYKGKTSAKRKVVVKNPVVRPAVSGSSTITKGKSAQFSVTYNRKRVSTKSCKWYSTSKSVATVGSTGRVYAKKAGTTYIYVKYKGKTSSKRKVVVKNPVTVPAKPKPPVSKPKPPVTKPVTCTKESDHNWVEQPGGIGEYHETIVKKALSYGVCRQCGFVDLYSDIDTHCSRFGTSYTVIPVGPEIYTWDQDLSIPYKCSKCGKTKTENWTERGEEKLRVYSPRDSMMVTYDPGACATIQCPECRAFNKSIALEKTNGYCMICPLANGKETYFGDDWRDKLIYPWDVGEQYIDWDESGREMVYEPESKTWKYTGR